MQNIKNVVRLLFLLCFMASPSVWATEVGPKTLTIDGRLYDNTFTNPIKDNVDFKIQILDSSKTCVIYEELQLAIDTNTTDGYFNLNIGTPAGDVTTRTANTDLNIQMYQVFQNATTVNAPTCLGATFTPSSGEVRYLRIEITPQATGIAEVLSPDMLIDAIPNALTCESINGLQTTDLIVVNSGASLTQANAEALTNGSDASSLHNHNLLYARIDGSNSFTGSVAMATQTTLELGDYDNTQETTLTGGLLAADAGKFWYNSQTGKVKYWDGAAAQEFATAASGMTSLAGDNTQVQTISIGAAGTTPAWVHNLSGDHLLNIPLANGAGVTSGTISKAEYDTFNGKQNALGFTPLDVAGSNNMTAALNMNSQKITNLATPTAGTDGTTKAYIDSLVTTNNGSYVPKAGGTFTGAIDFDALVRIDTTDNVFQADPTTNKVILGNTIGNASAMRLTLDNDGGIVAKGAHGSGATLTTTGSGTRMIWYPKKSAFRAGNVTGTQWNEANIGNYSTAFGVDNTASGANSFAAGNGNSASNTSSVALGAASTASGAGAVALSGATSSGTNSLAAGTGASSSAIDTMALGKSANASANYALAFGQSSAASNTNSVAIGNESVASGTSTVAIGEFVQSTGTNSFTLGHGAGSGSPLVNASNNSLAIGMNSSAPTLFIGDAGGGANISKVGLGTTSPTALFNIQSANVADSTDVTGSLLILENTTDTYLEFKSGVGAGTEQGLVFSDIGDNGTAGYDGWLLYNQNTNSMRIGTNNSDNITIESDGDVAIGTGAANEKLTIEGVLSLRSVAAPTLTANYGKIYVDTGDSDNLKYMMPSGTVKVITNSSYSTPGTMAGQDNTSVNIDGGAIDGTSIGSTTPASANFTTVAGSGDLTIDTNVLKVDVTNNYVGVGTATPSAELDVVGDSELNGLLTVQNTSGDFSEVVINSVNGGAQEIWKVRNQESTERFHITAQSQGDTSPAITVSNNNRLGINLGTSAPSANLDVNGTTNLQGAITLGSTVQYTGTPKDLTISTNSSDASDDKSFSLLSASASAHTRGASLSIYGNEYATASNQGDVVVLAGEAGQVRFHTGAAGAEKVTIDENGRVGINDTTPSYELDVTGTIRATNGVNMDLLTVGTTSGTSGQLRIIDGTATADTGYWEFYNNGDQLGLYTTDDSYSKGATASITFQRTANTVGNIGLRTNSPSTDLHFVGQTTLEGDSGDSFHQFSYENNFVLGRSGSAVSDRYGLGYNVDFQNASATYNFKANSDASLLYFEQNALRYKYSSAGTAGNPITFTDLFVIENNGMVGIADTNPDDSGNFKMHINGGLAVTDTTNESLTGGDKDNAFAYFRTSATDERSLHFINDSSNANAATTLAIKGDDSNFSVNVYSSTHASANKIIISNSGTDDTMIFRNNGNDAINITNSGSIGFGIATPSNSKYHFDGSGANGGLCVTSDGTCTSGAAGGEIAAETTLNTGADYAEYFATEENFASGDLVALDQSTGLARHYQNGDELLGVVSTFPGVVGNSKLKNSGGVLVALLGQVPVNRSEVVIINNIVYTQDFIEVGSMLANGNVFININPIDSRQARDIASLKRENNELKESLDELKKQNQELLQRVEKIEALMK